MAKSKDNRPEFRRVSRKNPLVRFEASPDPVFGDHGWWDIWRIPLFAETSEIGGYYDEGLPEKVVSSVPDNDVFEIVDALNDAFNEGRDFATWR